MTAPAPCANCGDAIEPGCGYTIAARGSTVGWVVCTLACGAELLGTLNLEMQRDFADDAEVDLRDRGDEEEGSC